MWPPPKPSSSSPSIKYDLDITYKTSQDDVRLKLQTHSSVSDSDIKNIALNYQGPALDGTR